MAFTLLESESQRIGEWRKTERKKWGAAAHCRECKENGEKTRMAPECGPRRIRERSMWS